MPHSEIKQNIITLLLTETTIVTNLFCCYTCFTRFRGTKAARLATFKSLGFCMLNMAKPPFCYYTEFAYCGNFMNIKFIDTVIYITLTKIV